MPYSPHRSVPVRTIATRIVLALCISHCATTGPVTATTPPPPQKSSAEKELVVNLAAHTWTAYDAAGQVIKTGRAIGGRDWCPDIKSHCHTPIGTFRVQRKGGAACVSKTFPLPDGGAPMPYCVFFHNGIAIHGWSGKTFTRHLSHGCVRVSIPDAKWMHDFLVAPTTENGYQGTKIRVLSY